MEIVATSSPAGPRLGTTSTYLLSTPESLAALADPAMTGDDLVRVLRAVASVVDEAFVQPRADGRIVYLCPLRGGFAYLPTGVDESDVDYFDPRTSAPSRAGAAVSVLGDTVARGAVLEAAIRGHVSARRTEQPWRLVVHGFLAAPGVARLVTLLDSYPPGERPVELVVVAYEALFQLPRTWGGRFGAQDFLRDGIECTRPYEELLASSPGLCLEKCAIYDTGDRAFTPERHETGRRAHWVGLAEMDEDALALECARRSGRSFAGELLRDCVGRVV